MKRRLRYAAAALLAAVLLALFAPAPALAASGLAPIRDYSEAGFTDVPDDWSREGIEGSYELGLMSGTAEGVFSPHSGLTVAEALTVAGRIHGLWRGGDGVLPESGERWYDGAVGYALENKIAYEGEFSDFDAEATRAQLAALLSRVLPETDYPAINSVASLPDVYGGSRYSAEILKLYNAGIVTGSDDYGTFHPDDSITRAEAAAIFCRVAKPETRKTFTLAEDLTVRGTDLSLVLDGVTLGGVVRIGDDYCIPAELFEYGTYGESIFSLNEYTDCYRLERYTTERGFVVPEIVEASNSGAVLGTARLSDKPLVFSRYMLKDGYWYTSYHYGSTRFSGEREISDAVYTIDGRYPMISLTALGAVRDGDSLALSLCQDEYGAPVCPNTFAYEEDLLGSAASSLRRDTQYDTVKAIHDFVVNTMTYDYYTSALGSTTAAQYAAEDAALDAASVYAIESNYRLAAGYGVCDDYSKLFSALCGRAGIPCVRLCGMVSGGLHAWNRVYVDGKWSFVDCTWDDPVGGAPTLRYNYFMKTADEMAKDHYWNEADYPMPLEYDESWEQIDPKHITSAEEYRKCLVAQLRQGKTEFTLYPVSSAAYGGSSCIYATGRYDFWWSSMSYGYNGAGGYTYHVTY